MSDLRISVGSVLNTPLLCGVLIVLCLCVGCGTTRQYEATAQLIASDAVDTAIAKIDFTPLTRQKVYFDTQYIKNYKGIGFTNAEYVISSLRQQMIAAGLLLQEKETEADFIVEGRIGALGTDDHELVYGIPSTSGLSAAASAVSTMSGVPAIPGIPELSVARRKDQVSAAKVGVFAYERETGDRVWQSGMSVARASAKDFWILGIGPFQRGTIYQDKLRFAGSTLDPHMKKARQGIKGRIAAYRDPTIFNPIQSEQQLAADVEEPTIQQASAEEVVPATDGE
ncbi:MAG: hypothetical protein KDA58_03200 [Planctomycetaceae bacterium]|nr:hypothetical protein [Planctomycetaceae bacterium]